MTLKVYISGPMTGKPKFNYPHFNFVETRLIAQRFEVLNPASVDYWHRLHEPACEDCRFHRKHDWRWYMRKCIVMLMDADGVATLEGWERSKGATTEVALARALDLPVMPWQSWVLRAVQHDDPSTIPKHGKVRINSDGKDVYIDRHVGRPKVYHWQEADGLKPCGVVSGRVAATREQVNCKKCLVRLNDA